MAFGHWLRGKPGKRSKVRMKRYRNKVHTCSDILQAQLPDEFIAIDSQPPRFESQRVEMPGVPATVVIRGKFKFGHTGECLVVSACNGCALCRELLDSAQLMYSDGD